MPEFTPEELNLIYLYNPGNLRGLLYELRSMQCVLMPDEKELRNLTERTIRKVETLTRDQYKELCESWSPEDCLLGFDLGLDQELADSINDMEES